MWGLEHVVDQKGMLLAFWVGPKGVGDGDEQQQAPSDHSRGVFAWRTNF